MKTGRIKIHHAITLEPSIDAKVEQYRETHNLNRCAFLNMVLRQYFSRLDAVPMEHRESIFKDDLQFCKLQ
jgi:hypothetical protein